MLSLNVSINESELSKFTAQTSQTEIEIWMHRILLAVYGIIFFVGLVGNFIVIYSVLFYKRMQTMTNKFITNLAVSDLLVIFICIPVSVMRLLYKSWIFGQFICRISGFVQGVSLSVSVLTLTAISIDRYYIIYKPMKARALCTDCKVWLVVSFIWLLSISAMSPLLFVAQYEDVSERFPQMNSFLLKNLAVIACFEGWSTFEQKLLFESIVILSIFILPILVMSYAYYKVSKTLWLTPKKSFLTKTCSQQEMASESVNLKSPVTIQNRLEPERNESSSKEPSKSSKKKVNQTNQLEKNRIKAPASNLESENESNLASKADIFAFEEENNMINTNPTYSKDLKQCELTSSVLDVSLKIKITNVIKSSKSLLNSENSSIIKPELIATSTHNIQVNGRSVKHKSNELSKKIIINSLVDQLMIYRRGSLNTSRASNLNSLFVDRCQNNNYKMANNHLSIKKLIKSRRRVVKMFLVLVAVFVISWMPYHIISMSIDAYLLVKKMEVNSTQSEDYSEIYGLGDKKNLEFLTKFMSPVVLCLALSSSAINPICYLILNQGFRSMIKSLFKKSSLKSGFYR